MATEDRKLKLVLKDHDCTRIGEIVPFSSFDAVSRVNDVGEATVVASYGASERSDVVLDALGTPDVILEAYIQPPGHTAFLDEPAWSGFLRDRRITQEGPTRTVTATFKDYNHLLQRRVVKPPEGSSHDEGYGCVPDVMRDLVRRQCAELADSDRRFPGLSVEANECDVAAGGMYTDTSDMVFGANAPNWVRVNCLYEWGGFLYLGTETQLTSGAYAAIYRSANGTTWTLVFDGAPDALYSYPVTSVNCFCEFEGQLYAGCTQNWTEPGIFSTGIGGDSALLFRTADGVNWALAASFPNTAGVWALAEFNSDLYAGTTGYTFFDSTTYLWRSPDGLAWAAAANVQASVYVGGILHHYLIRCESLREWNGYLYAGTSYRTSTSLMSDDCDTYTHRYGRIYRTPDGTTMTQVLSVEAAGEYGDHKGPGVLSLMEFGDFLYAGTGITRPITTFDWCASESFGVQSGTIWTTEDGLNWVQVFGSEIDADHVSDAITCLMLTTNYDGEPVLWALSGTQAGGSTRIYSTENGTDWIVVAYLTVIPYEFMLSVATFGGSYYVSTGCYAKTALWSGPGSWVADRGDVWRVVPFYGDVPESGMMGRWTSVLDKLREIAEQSGKYDFRVVGYNSFIYCGETQEFLFMVKGPQWGTDNRWDGLRGVSFSIQRGNMALPEYSEIRGARPTFLYLLGPAAAEERTVVQFYNTTAINESPWGRVEATADAQGIDSPTALTSVGLAELELQGPQKEFTFVALETDRGHFLPG